MVSICFKVLLYWVISPARVACALGSTTGAEAAAKPVKAVPVIAEPLPTVDDAALLVVVMVMAPVESMVACRLLGASAALRSLSVETWPAAVPNVMLVATPLPVEAMDSVLLVSALSACETPVPNPSAASAPELLLVMLRLLAVPVCNVILPLASIEATFAPVELVIWSMAVSTSCTVPVVLMVLPVALVLVALTLLKVRVLPSTVRVSPSANPVARAWLVGVDAPESAVVVLRTDAAAGTAILVTSGVVEPQRGQRRTTSVTAKGDGCGFIGRQADLAGGRQSRWCHP